ncbi:class III lanthionine synthetase LanKC [Nonomuraea sp. NPDC050310]|uniref:class III lanthionine synthetase LanKC n=1 Tax=Nonomuraea sp. NPDC050310 TaxID=3154935 RepID=UPI0033CD8829
MSEPYELHCLADPIFYDTFSGIKEDFPVCSRETPPGWRHHPTDTWMHYAPEDHRTPGQGWKIHLSARPDQAEHALGILWDYCVRQGVPFKFLRSRPVMTMLNSKAADRGASGKLATVYPKDDVQLKAVLDELSPLLAGVEGPYVLSDLRYGDGPLYVRYGGFLPREMTGANGRKVMAIEDPQGRLVPDDRGPGFALPPWVELPGFLEPHLAARNTVTTEALPYEIESVLAFSNGGGVYLATDRRSGERVVLKEARPHAGLDAAERDAVTRLAHERAILERLAGLDAAPRLIEHFTLGEHDFIVLEFVDGNPLQRQIVQRFPLARTNTTSDDISAYTGWALDLAARVEAALSTLHERGVVFGDLHPNNILITPEGRVVFIDYEVSSLAAENAPPALANPAYCPPRGTLGLDIDRYALACLRFNLFAPQTTIMLGLDRAKAHHLADLIAGAFPVPPAFLAEAVAVLAPGPRPLDLDRALRASATPERRDRLFPGDIAQFQPGGGIGLAYGAAGVLYAQHAAKLTCSEEHVTWLRRRAREDDLPPGFYDGAHGVAYVLDLLGHRQEALDLLPPVTGEESLDLFSGLAGIGLTRLRLGLDAGPVVALCAERLGGPADVPEISGGENPRAGLFYGSSGVALLFLHAYERGGDAGLLDLAATALRQDLRRCVRGPDGSLQVNQGWRTLPYLDEGSIGIALVLARYLRHRADEEFELALADARLVTRGGYFVQPGLFTGRAGLLAAQHTLGGPTGDLVRGLDWHALPYAGGTAFPGTQLMRLSMDLATGTAGVLLALSGADLPFLEPTGTPNTQKE